MRGLVLGSLAAVALLLGLSISGCGSLGSEIATGSALQKAGYQDVSVNFETGSGVPAGGVIEVSYSRGPTGNDRQDAGHAERIVWDTFSGRFGDLDIVKVSGGCVAGFCASQSGEIASASYAQLAASFGPRPRGLVSNGSSAASSVRIPGWALALVVALGVTVAAAAAIVLTMIIRRSRAGSRAAPPAPPWPPGPWTWPAGPPPPGH
jgi:hypothetical protein